MKISLNDLRQALRRNPRASGAELCNTLLKVSRPTLSRLVAQLDDEVIRLGAARRTRYAIRRQLRGRAESLPLYRIDSTGEGHLAGKMDLTYPEGSALSFVEPFPWPLEKNLMADGWFEGNRSPPPPSQG